MRYNPLFSAKESLGIRDLVHPSAGRAVLGRRLLSDKKTEKFRPKAGQAQDLDLRGRQDVYGRTNKPIAGHLDRARLIHMPLSGKKHIVTGHHTGPGQGFSQEKRIRHLDIRESACDHTHTHKMGRPGLCPVWVMESPEHLGPDRPGLFSRVCLQGADHQTRVGGTCSHGHRDFPDKLFCRDFAPCLSGSVQPYFFVWVLLVLAQSVPFLIPRKAAIRYSGILLGFGTGRMTAFQRISKRISVIPELLWENQWDAFIEIIKNGRVWKSVEVHGLVAAVTRFDE